MSCQYCGATKPSRIFWLIAGLVAGAWLLVSQDINFFNLFISTLEFIGEFLRENSKSG